MKSIFSESKVFVEVTYYLLASLLIPIAYFQYIHEKNKDKKGAIQYAHHLFKDYTESILTLDVKYDKETINSLSLASNQKDIEDFNTLLNKIDTFAAAFNFGVADINTGKKMMGNTYCEQIKSYLPAIKIISGDRYRDGLENLFELYEKWERKDG